MQVRVLCRHPFHYKCSQSADDVPQYKQGDRVLLALAITNIVLYLLTNVYYVFRNMQRERKWNALTEPGVVGVSGYDEGPRE